MPEANDRKVGATTYARVRAACVALLLALVTAPSWAATRIVKPGLWDMTVTTRVSEARTEIPELGKSPTGEKAKVDAEMRKPVVAPDVVRHSRECVSAKAASRWSTLTRLELDYAACSRKPVTQNARHFRATLTCTAARSSGQADFTSTREALQGQIAIVTHEPAYDKTETKLIEGRWVGPDCRAAESGQQ